MSLPVIYEVFGSVIKHDGAGSQRVEGNGGEHYAQHGRLCFMGNVGLLLLTH